jgi:predicted GIY-YIG superfamily endonuclease
MASYVYILRSATTGRHLIGSTNDLTDRVAKYNRTFTGGYRPGEPWECVYVEVCNNLGEARQRERHLKSMEGVDEKIQILYSTPWRGKSL